MGETLSMQEVLAAVPQQAPFRFIDEILELDREHIVARASRDAKQQGLQHAPAPALDLYRAGGELEQPGGEECDGEQQHAFVQHAREAATQTGDRRRRRAHGR